MAAWGELIGGISGFVAALGVILTLIYLARQMRQNTEAVRLSMVQGLERQVSDLTGAWTRSVETAALMSRGLSSSYEELSDDERAFVRLSVRRMLLSFDTLYWSYRRGLLPDELWEREKSVLVVVVNSPAGRSAWRGGGGFTESFREFVDNELKAV